MYTYVIVRTEKGPYLCPQCLPFSSIIIVKFMKLKQNKIFLITENQYNMRDSIKHVRI